MPRKKKTEKTEVEPTLAPQDKYSKPQPKHKTVSGHNIYACHDCPLVERVPQEGHSGCHIFKCTKQDKQVLPGGIDKECPLD